jgi:hypothetical protein
MPSEKEILSLRQDLLNYWREAHVRWQTLIDVYHGNYHELWPAEFRRGEVPKVANWIKLAWDRYAKMVGKLPSNHVPPNSAVRMTQNRADKVEHILVSYDNQSGIESLLKWYAWYLVGLGAGSFGVMPDPVLKGPRYFVKDPRVTLVEPGAGSIPLTSTAYGYLSEPRMQSMTVGKLILNETMTTSAVMNTYKDIPEIADKVDYGNSMSPASVVTYMDEEYWCLLINEKKVHEVYHDLGWVPVRMTTQFIPEQLGGQSQFEQNIGLVLAYIRTLNQKLTYNSNVVWPWLVVRGLNNMDPEERVIEILDQQGDAQFLSPPGELQIERDMEVLDRLIRVMNHDTEALQGTAPGSIVTGRAVDSLNQDVRQLVLDYWDIMRPDLEFVKACALAIDEKVYPNTRKEIFGRAHGEQFTDAYIPSKDIRGYRNVTIDFGIGVGGLEGFTEMMQTAAQGFLDETTIMENLPYIKSVSLTRQRVMLDRMEKVIFEMVAQGAPAPIINHMTQWRQVVEKGEDYYKWIAENPFPEPTQPGGAPGEVPPAPGQAGLPVPPPGQGAPPAIPNIPSPAQLLALGQGRR